MEDEIELVDVGDAVVETKQSALHGDNFDSFFGWGRWI